MLFFKLILYLFRYLLFWPIQFAGVRVWELYRQINLLLAFSFSKLSFHIDLRVQIIPQTNNVFLKWIQQPQSGGQAKTEVIK